ncbi:MAG TPA: efflux RND transporter periplasmic adaptor subunit [Gemmatimonadales bacterium]|jgi:Cu(I)/Ag(I) efflux system membrane fusion protein|nr:efflux RND transporter periplasmic adaptor subunit [Gemmatimonadales bacterium]
MKRALVLLSLGVLACRTQRQDSMAGMDMSDSTAAADSGMAGRAPVHLTPEQARAVGVTFTVVQRGPLTRMVRTVGQVVPAEPNLAEITTKIDGFVEQLYVNATGESVRRGQPLLTLYSPMLVAAQEELLAAKRLAAAVDSNDTDAWRSGQALVEASRRRLSYWDISREQIERLERTSEVTKTLTLNAPVDGIVLEKMVVAGQAVMPGMKLYRIADLSTVWIEGAVFEQDLGLVRVGTPVSAEFTAYPGRKVAGRVSFVWPTVDDSSRSGRIRVAFQNPVGELRPGMYATLLLEAVVNRDAVNVPAEAVVQTGERNLVFVVGPSGALEPRAVVLGARAGDRFQIDSGLAAGERIVASANFLVDAESRLTAGAGSNMPGMNMGTEKRP